MPKSNGSERSAHPARAPLILLAAAAVASGLLYEAMPAEGLQATLRLFSLLPLQLAALAWVLPRMR